MFFQYLRLHLKLKKNFYIKVVNFYVYPGLKMPHTTAGFDQDPSTMKKLWKIIQRYLFSLIYKKEKMAKAFLRSWTQATCKLLGRLVYCNL